MAEREAGAMGGIDVKPGTILSGRAIKLNEIIDASGGCGTRGGD
jgi:hypothetical protein